jgi:hypothetical protein
VSRISPEEDKRRLEGHSDPDFPVSAVVRFGTGKRQDLDRFDIVDEAGLSLEGRLERDADRERR